MSNIKDDYDAALALAKQGKYKKAQQMLAKHKEHPGVKPLYDKVVENLKAHNKRTDNYWIIGIIATPIILLGLLWLYGQMTVTDGTLELYWYLTCTDVAIEAIANNGIEFTDSISEAYRGECNRQAESAVSIHRDEIAYCYWETNRAKLEVQFVNCLDDNDVWINTQLLAVVINGAR